jgi:hypothetical protein
VSSDPEGLHIIGKYGTREKQEYKFNHLGKPNKGEEKKGGKLESKIKIRGKSDV